MRIQVFQWATLCSRSGSQQVWRSQCLHTYGQTTQE